MTMSVQWFVPELAIRFLCVTWRTLQFTPSRMQVACMFSLCHNRMWKLFCSTCVRDRIVTVETLSPLLVPPLSSSSSTFACSFHCPACIYILFLLFFFVLVLLFPLLLPLLLSPNFSSSHLFVLFPSISASSKCYHILRPLTFYSPSSSPPAASFFLLSGLRLPVTDAAAWHSLWCPLRFSNARPKRVGIRPGASGHWGKRDWQESWRRDDNKIGDWWRHKYIR